MTLAAALACAPALGACTTSSPGPGPSAAVSTPDAGDVVASLGAVPIPTAGTSAPTATASGGRTQVLAMGDPVVAVLSGGARSTVVASGPEQDTTAVNVGPGAKSGATMTVTIKGGSGTTTVRASDLSSRDDEGHTIPLTAIGASSVSVGPGTTARLKVHGTFQSGSAQLTWTPPGSPAVAVWVFTIELD